MMRDLYGRRLHWNVRTNRAPYAYHDMSDSLPYPFMDAGMVPQDLFGGKDVLEIGPGNGRQYACLHNLAKTYYIADLSPKGLAEPAFDDVDGKFLIDDWEQYLGRTFDVVHFWYVLHHILRSEMTEFFTFISSHLRSSGLVCFNTPDPIRTPDAGQWSSEGDGCGVTYSDPIVVRCAIADLPLSVKTEVHVGRKSTGYVMLLRKRWMGEEVEDQVD